MRRIIEYFNELEAMICVNEIITDLTIINREITPVSGFWKGILKLIDGTELHVIEYLVIDRELVKSKYKYHWQDEDSNLIIRWDNAPHHPEISSFPHHIHTQTQVNNSHNITLREILDNIKSKIEKTGVKVEFGTSA